MERDMTKKLFLCRFTLREQGYMDDDVSRTDYVRAVWADSIDDAENAIHQNPEFKTDEYAVYRDVECLDVSEALGLSDDA